MYVPMQDPDYSVEMEVDHPEFRKLAFTSPGPKNAFAPLQRSGYGRQQPVAEEGGRRGEVTEAVTTAANSKELQVVLHIHVHVQYIVSSGTPKVTCKALLLYKALWYLTHVADQAYILIKMKQHKARHVM